MPPTADSSTIVYEFIEPTATWHSVLDGRRGMLQASAVAVCDLHQNWYEVVFRPNDSNQPFGRAVRVRKDFSEVEMVHQEFKLGALDDSGVACEVFD